MIDLIRIVAAGAAIACLHAVGGLMLTPFFGASPFFWSNVLASYPVSLSVGIVLGSPLRRGRSQKSTPRLAVLAGLLLLCVPGALAPLARGVLDHDPDALLAPAVTVFCLITLPSAVAAALLPLRARGGRTGKRTLIERLVFSEGAPLFLFAVGSAVGMLVTAPFLLEAGERPVWPSLWLFGVVLCVFGAVGFGRLGRLCTLGAGSALVAAFLTVPAAGEVRSFAYRKALRSAWDLRVGRYYLDTAGRRVLEQTEALARYDELREKITYASDKTVVAVLIVETLKSMGRVELTGEGLQAGLDLHLPEKAKVWAMPLVEQIGLVRSDGHGRIAFSLRQRLEQEPIRVELPTSTGMLTFLFTGDFYLQIRVADGERESRTFVDIGPVSVEKAGFLETNDSYETPVLLEDVSFFFDAHLLGLTIVTRPDTVTLLARGQGAIGGVKESVIQVVDLRVNGDHGE